MEELYSETYLRAKLPPKKTAVRVLMIFLAVLILAVGVFAMLLMGTILVFLVMLLVAGLILFLMPTANIAYEYIFVDGQIDFDCIFKGQKRKTVKRVDMEKIELIAPENTPYLDSYQNCPLVDYSSRMDTDHHYIAVALGEKGTERIRFTPDDKMLRMIWMKSPGKLKKADESRTW
ncbi:MAG: DUF6106 family protein [Clostridiaceae bacterium]|nr:DUF6106 family protein [Clostridiaceae bacterium]